MTALTVDARNGPFVGAETDPHASQRDAVREAVAVGIARARDEGVAVFDSPSVDTGYIQFEPVQGAGFLVAYQDPTMPHGEMRRAMVTEPRLQDILTAYLMGDPGFPQGCNWDTVVVDGAEPADETTQTGQMVRMTFMGLAVAVAIVRVALLQ